jgi:O-antigen ligase
MIAVALGAIVFTAILLLPTDWLPAAALVVFLIVPRVALNVNDVLSTVSPSLIVIVLWYVRCWAESRRARQEGREPERISAWVKILVVLLLLWIVVLLLWRGPRLTSLAWTFAFVVLCLLILFVPHAAKAIRNLQATFLWSAAILAVYCVLEYIAGENFVFERVNALVSTEPLQHWSVYRAYGSLGHPLYAGLFFAMAFAIAFGRRFSGGGNRNLVFAALSMLGVVLTVSRSSVGAVAVAAGVIVLPSLVRRSALSPAFRGFLAVLVVGGVYAITQVSAFQDRIGSDEAQGSTDARNAVFDLSMLTAQAYDWLGAGPAMALQAAAPFNPNAVIIESAYLQLLISLGIPGLVLVGLLVAAGSLRAMRVGAYAGLGALVAFCVNAAFFNILESSRPSLILLGFALLMAWRENPAVSLADEGSAAAPMESAPALANASVPMGVRGPSGR